MSRLVELASTIRSKNAGVDHITFDILFSDLAAYKRVKESQVLTPERVASLYHVRPERVVRFVAFDPARAIKFTIRRNRPSGSPGEGDVMGSQQYAPLLDLEVPPGDRPKLERPKADQPQRDRREPAREEPRQAADEARKAQGLAYPLGAGGPQRTASARFR